MAPNGRRHSCIGPDTRVPPPPPSRSVGVRRLPDRAEAQDVAAQAGRHRHHGGDHRAARAGQLHAAVDPGGADAQGLLDRGHPALAHPHRGRRAGVGGQAVDVVEGEPRVGDRLEAGVDRERQRDRPSAAARWRCGRRPTAPTGARSDRRSPAAAAPGARARRPGRRRSTSPVGSNSGSHTSSSCSKRDHHLLADDDLVGVAPDDVGGEVHRRVLGEGHVGDDVGRVEPGQPGVLVDREGRRPSPARTPRPARRDRLRHRGQMGTGGWTRALQSSQPWIRRRPSAPEVQNHSLTGVSWGSRRTG